MSEQPTPRTDAAAYTYEDEDTGATLHVVPKKVCKELERELAEATRIRLDQAETIHQLRAEAAEWMTDGELVNKAHKLKLERELAESKHREFHLRTGCDRLTHERDQWREVAEGFSEYITQHGTLTGLRVAQGLQEKFRNLKEASK